MLESFITRADFCARLGLHPATARRWELSGKLTPYAITGGVIRYREADVQRLLNEARHSRRRKPGPKPRPRPATAHPQPNSGASE